MADYQLYCFAQSGNAYRAALMLNLIGADWQPIFVDFFNGETRTAEYRSTVNEMGEAPVLVHGAKKLSQSGVILLYLADRFGKFLPLGEAIRLEALRWIIFDNQKLNGLLAPYRFLHSLAKPKGDPAVLAFLKARIDNALRILDKQLALAPTCSGRSRPSPISRWSGICIIRLRNSASTWPPNTRISAPGLSASRRSPAGRIPTI